MEETTSLPSKQAEFSGNTQKHFSNAHTFGRTNDGTT